MPLCVFHGNDRRAGFTLANDTTTTGKSKVEMARADCFEARADFFFLTFLITVTSQQLAELRSAILNTGKLPCEVLP